jgi:hypothetical protein
MSQYDDYVTHSDALEAAGMNGSENMGCVVCDKEVPACAVCGVCHECHATQRYWHMTNLITAWECEALGRCQRMLRSLDDGDLRQFSESADVGGYASKQIRMELGFRRVINRARELGCDFYCPEHDCETKNCPAGSHGDD